MIKMVCMRPKHAPPTCHPEAAYFAKGTCRPCYMRRFFKEHPEAREQFNQIHPHYMVEWRRMHPEHLRRYQTKRNHKRRTDAEYRAHASVVSRYSVLKWKYGLSREMFEQLVRLQNKRCAICRNPIMRAERDYAVDHDHDIRRARGLLCQPCNKALGGFRENIVFLKRAIAYLLSGGPVALLEGRAKSAKP